MKLRFIVGLGSLAAAVFSQAIIIDDFSDGNVSLLVSGGAGLASLDAATVLGGDRATWIDQGAFVGSRTSELNVSGGWFSISNPIGTDSVSSLAYGVNSVSNGGGFGVDSAANFNMSAFNTYRLNFEGNDQPLTVFLGIYTNNASGAIYYSKAIAGGQFGAFTVDISAADVVGGFGTPDLTDVDQIRFDFYTSNAGDFALTSVEAVPEPATLTVLGLGAAALLRRRRRA